MIYPQQDPSSDWQSLYTGLAGAPIVQPLPLPAMSMALMQPQQPPPNSRTGGINPSKIAALIKRLRGGSSEATRANAVHALGPLGPTSSEAARANAVHSLGPLSSGPALTSEAARANAVHALGPLSGGTVTSGLSGADATALLTSDAAYGGAGAAGGAAGAAGGATGLSTFGAAGTVGVGAGIVAMPFILDKYFGGGPDPRWTKAEQIFKSGGGTEGAGSVKVATVGNNTFVHGSPDELYRLARQARAEGIQMEYNGRTPYAHIAANGPNTLSMLTRARGQSTAPFMESRFGSGR